MKLEVGIWKNDIAGYQWMDKSDALKLDRSRSGLREVLNSLGLDVPCTLLHRGYTVDNDSIPDEGTLLAVPRDPVVRVLLPTVERKSVGSFSATVQNLKQLQMPIYGDAFIDLVILDVVGRILDDDCALKSAQSFEQANYVVCKRQLVEYSNVQAENGTHCEIARERVSWCERKARSCQENWCLLEDMSLEVKEVVAAYQERMTKCLKLADSTAASANLAPFEFSRFVQDFPPQETPICGNSQNLIDLKLELSAMVNKNSKSPKEVVAAINQLQLSIQNTNAALADGATSCLVMLLDPVSKLAEKEPMIHDHVGYHEKLRNIQRAIKNYREIKAGKMYSNPNEYEAQQQSLAVLNNEMKQASICFDALKGEWDHAVSWADLSAFDDVEEEHLAAAVKAAEVLVHKKNAELKDEQQRLESLLGVARHSVFFYNLIQKQEGQATWCIEAVQAATNAVDADLSEIDARIAELMQQRAEKAVLKLRQEQRVRDLEAHAKAEAARYEDFRSKYNAKESAIRERVRHAEVADRAAQALQHSVVDLAELVRVELDILKTKALQLRLDVGADLAEAYRLGCNTNFMLAYYEEVKIKGLNKQKAKQSNEYQVAMREELHEEAQVLRDKMEKLESKLIESGQRVEFLNARSVELASEVGPAWALLCANAVGGPVETRIKRICVRPSKENLEAWNGDRELEHPDGWNQEMKAEADAFGKLLIK